MLNLITDHPREEGNGKGGREEHLATSERDQPQKESAVTIVTFPKDNAACPKGASINDVRIFFGFFDPPLLSAFETDLYRVSHDYCLF